MSLLSLRNMDTQDSPWSRSAVGTGLDEPDTEFWETVGSAGAAIGSDTFYDRLLAVLSSLVEADLASLVRYSSFGAPDLIIPREIRTGVAAPYDSGLYAFDP